MPRRYPVYFEVNHQLTPFQSDRLPVFYARI